MFDLHATDARRRRRAYVDDDGVLLEFFTRNDCAYGIGVDEVTPVTAGVRP